MANPAEAKKWRDLADATLSKAAKVCASPKVLAAFYAINKKERENAQVAAVIGSIVTGITLNPGDIRVTEIVAEDVASMDSSFTCRVYGDRVGAVIDASSVSDVEYYTVDGFGNYKSQGDNSADKVVAKGIANLGKNLAQRPYKGRMKMESLGDMRYKLTQQNYSVTLDLR